MRIALTHTGNPEKHQYYVDWLKANEDIEVIKLSAEDNNLTDMFSCDALVLSGGVDVHPKFYRNENSAYPGAPEKFNEKRDEFEIAAFWSAQEKNMAVLGICRGLQLINVIHNGTLIQNLEQEKLNKVHTGNPDKSHSVTIAPGTILYDIVGSGKTEINSAHHQAIDKLGDELSINATADDGVIEGIERLNHPGKPFLLAIQWHPERMFRFHLKQHSIKSHQEQVYRRNKKINDLKNENH